MVKQQIYWTCFDRCHIDLRLRTAEILLLYNISRKKWINGSIQCKYSNHGPLFKLLYLSKAENPRKKTGDKNSLTLPPLQVQGLVCIPNLHRKQLDCLEPLLAFLELKWDLLEMPTNQRVEKKKNTYMLELFLIALFRTDICNWLSEERMERKRSLCICMVDGSKYVGISSV